MVAYNFKLQFASAVVSGEKPQTIRALRKERPLAGISKSARHAQASEALQLYTGMRTATCKS